MDTGSVALLGAVAGVLGAAVGGGCAIGAAALTGRKQAAAQHSHWRRQLRRDAYASLLSCAFKKSGEIDKVQTALLRGSLDLATAALPPALELEALHEACNLVALEGPQAASRAAGELLTAISGRVPLLLLAVEQGSLGGEDDLLSFECEQRRREASEALEAFKVLAQRLLD
ncbi:hypothetical protein ACWD5W_25575 [Streptomyces sp. NPDC002455]